MASSPPPPPGFGSQPVSKPPLYPPPSVAPPVAAAPVTPPPPAASVPPVTTDPITEEIADELAEAENRRLVQEAHTLSYADILEQYDVDHPPSDQYPYLEEIGTTVPKVRVTEMFERLITEKVARQAMDYAGEDELEAAFDRFMQVDQFAAQQDAETMESNYVHVMMGVPDKELLLARENHAVRVLATRKAGKTTYCLEVIRCSVTGEMAFGSVEVSQLAPDETILFLDPELSTTDYAIYTKDAFRGLTETQLAQIKHVPTSELGSFDLMSHATRDVLIKMITKYNVKRVIFDSYTKMIPNGSVSTEADVKRVWNAWTDIKAATGVRESFWIGHTNNSGDRRSSGSIVWDASFESLHILELRPDGTRTFGTQEGRKTSVIENAPYYLDPSTQRPMIDFGTSLPPVPVSSVATRGRAAKTEGEATLQLAVNAVIEKIVLKTLYRMGPKVDPNGVMDQFGGLAKAKIPDEVAAQWADEISDSTVIADSTPVPTRYMVNKVLNPMIGTDKYLESRGQTTHAGLWFLPSGIERIREIVENEDQS